jgi:hypothetical protein
MNRRALFLWLPAVGLGALWPSWARSEEKYAHICWWGGRQLSFMQEDVIRVGLAALKDRDAFNRALPQMRAGKYCQLSPEDVAVTRAYRELQTALDEILPYPDES